MKKTVIMALALLGLLVAAGCTEEQSSEQAGELQPDVGMPDSGTPDAQTQDTTLEPDAGEPDVPEPPEDVPEPPQDTEPDLPPDEPDVPEPPEDTGMEEDSMDEPDTGGPMGDGCGVDPGANDRVWTVQHDGRQREFKVHLPPNYDPQARTPVVINYHGRALNADAQINLSRMLEVSDAQGFIAVHPEGTGSLDRGWNAGLCCGDALRDEVDDVGFTRVMLDALESGLCVDSARVYATGISNGGFMSHKLACELSDRITAIAPVAGTIVTFECEPSRPVPVFQFHGDDDRIVPYDGFAGIASVEVTTEGWLERNGCADTSEVFFDVDDVICEAWSDCSPGGEVRLCTVRGGGHTWPGGESLGLFGDLTETISASEMMWDFFSQHAIPAE